MKLRDFILSDNKEVSSYVHTTNTEENCKKILEEGFHFNQFDFTTDEISVINAPNEAQLEYKLRIRKQYGDFVIVIQIKNQYRKDLEKMPPSKRPFQNEDGDLLYTLPKEFIKGYFNKITNSIIENPYFNLNHKPHIAGIK